MVNASLDNRHSRQYRKHELAERLRGFNVRLTAQRLAIAEVLANATDHPSAQDVYEKVRDILPHITRGTIYNTLNRLVECGFVRALAFPGGSRYDANLTSHINMVCTACGAIFDILGHEDEIRLLKRELSRTSNFDIVSERLDFYGMCIGCREKLVSD